MLTRRADVAARNFKVAVDDLVDVPADEFGYADFTRVLDGLNAVSRRFTQLRFDMRFDLRD